MICYKTRLGGKEGCGRCCEALEEAGRGRRLALTCSPPQGSRGPALRGERLLPSAPRSLPGVWKPARVPSPGNQKLSVTEFWIQSLARLGWEFCHNESSIYSWSLATGFEVGPLGSPPTHFSCFSLHGHALVFYSQVIKILSSVPTPCCIGFLLFFFVSRLAKVGCESVRVLVDFSVLAMVVSYWIHVV